MRYITDQHAAEIPALRELDQDARRQVLADAARVHARVQRDPWITDEKLREYGERNDLPPDRLNAALQLLEATGQLFTISEQSGRVASEITQSKT